MGMNGYEQGPSSNLPRIHQVNLFAGIRISIGKRNKSYGEILDKAKIPKSLRDKYNIVKTDAFYFGKEISSLTGLQIGKKIDLSQIEKKLEKVRKDIPNAKLFLINDSYQKRDMP